jgi:sugar phosphate isomerase/epimerase
MNRRNFLKTSALLAAAAATPTPAVAADEKPATTRPAQLKLSSQIWVLPGKTDQEKVENLIKWGGVGVELPASFNVKDVQKMLDGTPVKVSAICAADGPYIVSDAKQRRKAVDNAKHILEKAGQVGSTGVIMVPAFNGVPGELQGREGHKVLVDLLQELGEHAVKHQSRMLLEPLNRKECWFLRQLAYAASICQEVNSPGVQMMGDFYHMQFEEPSDDAAFAAAGPWCHHVHLASRRRVLPGQDERSFIDGFRGLKRIGYQDYMSLECGVDGKREEEIPKAFDFIRQQWEQATI